MEDVVRVVLSFILGVDCVYHFFGVFDGHGGSQAALHCKERLHEALAKEIHLTDPVTATEWEFVMKAYFLKMDMEVAGLCGSGKQLDGRGFESQGHTETSEPSEAWATETLGSTVVVAVVTSVLGVLAMSRAIGDKYLKPYVIAKPDLRVRERENYRGRSQTKG
ncbi:hypothetical protein SUGI_1023310 [Cryptomeria japonica]|nr:hypothetical protein SUGI_1023310 [Cryptomeria japonica]